MHGRHCVQIWHLNLPCGFAENFPAITWRVMVKSKQIVCITHLIIKWRNKWVCKIGKSANKLWFFICCMQRTCVTSVLKIKKKLVFTSLVFTSFLLYLKVKEIGETPPLLCFSSFHRLPSLGPGLEALLNRLLIN